MSDQLALFRVRPGMRFGAENQYAEGDVIELPVAVLPAFADKLESVEPDAVQVEPEPEVTKSTRTRKTGAQK
jgi:hypothetical protein